MEDTKFLISTIFVLFIVSGTGVFIYIAYMNSKKGQFPHINFSRFTNNQVDIQQIEQLTNAAIRGVNGWMWLATTFMALYYFINFWNISLMVLNIIMIAYDAGKYHMVALFLTTGSLLLTCLDLFIDTKEKGNKFHKQWFVTSAITKEYIVKFTTAKSIEEIRALVIEFNNIIYQYNKNITFF